LTANSLSKAREFTCSLESLYACDLMSNACILLVFKPMRMYEHTHLSTFAQTLSIHTDTISNLKSA